jgi:ketosteroid isomerase-like protein
MVGCVETPYAKEKSEINALLDKLQAAIFAKNLSETISYFADPITNITTAGESVTKDHAYLSSIYQTYFNLYDYAAYQFINRNIKVTSSTSATVKCVESITDTRYPYPLTANMKYTLAKNDGAWKITVVQFLPTP